MSKLTLKQQRFADEYIIGKKSRDSYGIVYLITNLINDKKYVGITTRNIYHRFEEHCKAKSAIGRAINKYGREAFSIRTLEEALDKEELFYLEKEYIKRYDSYRNGYNRTIGGDGANLVEDLSIVLSEKQEKFVKQVVERNKCEWDVKNEQETMILVLRTHLMLYLTAKKARDKILVSKTIVKYPFVLESLVTTGLVTKDEIIHYSNQKLSSFEVYHEPN